MKKNDEVNGNKKTRHQEYMLNSNMVITDCNKNKDDTVIHGNINNKETNESINNNDTDRVKAKTWPKGLCLITGDSMLGHLDETRMSRKFKVKFDLFLEQKQNTCFTTLCHCQ